jgi:hypothetical protein
VTSARGALRARRLLRSASHDSDNNRFLEVVTTRSTFANGGRPWSGGGCAGFTVILTCCCESTTNRLAAAGSSGCVGELHLALLPSTLRPSLSLHSVHLLGQGPASRRRAVTLLGQLKAVALRVAGPHVGERDRVAGLRLVVLRAGLAADDVSKGHIAACADRSLDADNHFERRGSIGHHGQADEQLGNLQRECQPRGPSDKPLPPRSRASPRRRPVVHSPFADSHANQTSGALLTFEWVRERSGTRGFSTETRAAA